MSEVRKSLFKRINNRLLHLLCRFLPGATSLRPTLHRARGVRITGRVFIGDDVYIDGEYPECVEIHDGVQIGPRSMIIAHTRGAGRVVLRENSFVGANSVIVTSRGKTLTIGEGAVVTASSLITSDVPPHMLMGGERAKALARATTPFTAETSFDDFVRGLRPLLDKSSGE